MPRVSGGPKRSRTLAVRIGPELWRKLVALAYRYEMTVPEVTRLFLAQAVEAKETNDGK